MYAAQIEEKVASLRKIFAASPALADYEPLEAIPEDASELRRADYHGHPPRRVSKAEFIDQLVPATIIAGLLGPKTLANALMMSFFGGLDIGPLSTAEERATPQCPPPGFDFPQPSLAFLSLLFYRTRSLESPEWIPTSELFGAAAPFFLQPSSLP